MTAEQLAPQQHQYEDDDEHGYESHTRVYSAPRLGRGELWRAHGPGGVLRQPHNEQRTIDQQFWRVERSLGELGWLPWSEHYTRSAALREAATARKERGGKFRKFRVVKI